MKLFHINDIPKLEALPLPLWRPMPPDDRKDKGYHPNHIHVNDRDRIIVITCWKSDPDFSLNKAALDRAITTFGYTIVIRLMDNKTFVAQESADTVANNLRGVSPIDGQWGPFWWINEHFKKPEFISPF